MCSLTAVNNPLKARSRAISLLKSKWIQWLEKSDIPCLCYEYLHIPLLRASPGTTLQRSSTSSRLPDEQLEEARYPQMITPDHVDQAESCNTSLNRWHSIRNRPELSSIVCSNMERIMSNNCSSLVPHWALPWCQSSWSSTNILLQSSDIRGMFSQ